MHINPIGTVVSYETWMAALFSSACIGFTSLVPWLFNLTFFEAQKKQQQQQNKQTNRGDHDGRMKYLLSFAVGAILGDIFFHLIPESYQSYIQELGYSHGLAHKKVGLSIIAGIFMFIIVEMMLERWSNSMKCDQEAEYLSEKTTQYEIIDVAGYLSLIANGLDNFTHGLAIGASFLVGSKVGLLTTFVIFIHEIPHEICDYAILVNSGFSRLEAVKAQSSVSLFGLLGTATALYVKSVDALTARTLWILPFSAGGFLYIALVNLLPEILGRDANIRNTVGQVACVILGVSFMAAVAVF